VAREQGQRGAHQARRDQQDRAGGDQVEERGHQPARVGRIAAASEELDVEGGGGAQGGGNAQCRECDAELEHPVDEHRPAHPSDETRRRHRACRQAAHVGGEHRGDRELGGAEHERELPRPRRLVDQGGEARQEEAGQQQRETQTVHSVWWLGVTRPGRDPSVTRVIRSGAPP
jgi:hypothetical protein